jgi:hypothetical protein
MKPGLNDKSGSLMMEAVRTSETSVDNHFTRQYIPEDNSEHLTRRRENLKSHKVSCYSAGLEINRLLLNPLRPNGNYMNHVL